MKKKIIIDVDDVMLTFGMLKYVNEFLNTNYTMDDLTSYYIQDLLQDRKEEFFKNFNNMNFYDNVPLFKDTYSVIEKLNEKYDVYICSAFIYKEMPEISGIQLNNKFTYLLKALPFINPNKFIFTSSKLIIDADIRIDDNIMNLGNAEKNFLFTAYHNKNFTKEQLDEKGYERVNNWLEIEKLLID